MASRDIKELVPSMRYLCETWIQRVKVRGVDPLIYCTYRSPEEQDELYARGRTTPGRIVTKARAWQSYHQMRRAWDAVPIVGGKPLWNFSMLLLPMEWLVMQQEAHILNIEWGGRWNPKFRDPFHFQVKGNKTKEEAKQEALEYEATLK